MAGVQGKDRMSSAESVAWLGKAKSEPILLSEVDNGTWLGKADAAKLLKVSTRSLERDAQRGAIARMYLPRRPAEKSARAVYSRADIEALLAEESTQSDRLITKKEACDLLDKSPRSLNQYMSSGKLSAHYITGAGGREARFDREEVERLRIEFDTPIDSATHREKLGLLPPPPTVSNDAHGNLHPPSAVSLARIDPEAVTTAAEAFAAALRDGLRPESAPKPWLTLAEAAEYSGLPAAYLLNQAKASLYADVTADHGIAVINVGSDKQHRWRFRRDSLGGAK